MMQIIVDLRRNVLRLQVGESSSQPTQQARLPAVLDIGEAGTLLGLELSLGDSLTLALPDRSPKSSASGDAYLALSDRASPLARSAKIEVDVIASESGEIAEIIVPRRGSTYEISFPSGNQCWLPKRTATGDKQPIGWCSVVEG